MTLHFIIDDVCIVRINLWMDTCSRTKDEKYPEVYLNNYMFLAMLKHSFHLKVFKILIVCSILGCSIENKLLEIFLGGVLRFCI